MDKKILEAFEKSNALQTGHFVLTSGRHSDKYMQCAQVFQYPKYSNLLSEALVDKIKHLEIDVVVGPAMGGLIFGFNVAQKLGVKSIFAERVEKKMTFKRGFTINPGEKVLIVEDVITTGGSVKEVMEVVEGLGGEVVAVGCAVDRTAGKDVGYEFYSLYEMDIKSYEPHNCPMCKEKMPTTKPGSTGKK
ncbi:orotate phosphoribosyltransferase [Proteinivorax hydrogeniformans]|uniref:Orotate phosphoribosyltransferase n=1 Tax=Proteinivorax hydrogeniformans TaxID=1826727 RepID=A0AAU8HPR9_9FIRM